MPSSFYHLCGNDNAVDPETFFNAYFANEVSIQRIEPNAREQGFMIRRQEGQ